MGPKKVIKVEGETKQERANHRQQLGSLRSLTVSAITRQRYSQSLAKFRLFLSHNHLEIPRARRDMDPLVCEYLEFLWGEGEGRATANTFVAALQDYQPSLKGELKGAWRLLKVWASHELPNRAPPLPEKVMLSMVGYNLFHERPLFALSLLLGFYTMLRTGELLGVQRRHVFMHNSRSPAVISLGYTKAGQRQGALESVTCGVTEVLRRLWAWKTGRSDSQSLTPSPHHWRTTFHDTLTALNLADLGFRPYSLRRGGATFWFNKHHSFEKLLVQGRWAAAKTARIYLNEGLAVLAEMKVPWKSLQPFLNVYYSSLPSPLPQLEQTRRPSRPGRGKQQGSRRNK